MPGSYPTTRNTWVATVVSVERMGDTTRVELGSPVPLSVDITPGAAADLELRPGDPVWAAVKATEVAVQPT